MNTDIFINAVLALFAVLNPVGIIPIYSEFTESLSRRGRFKVYNVAVATGFFTLLFMTLTGRWIMSTIFQIDILEFRIAGGILLTVLSVKYIVFPDQKESSQAPMSSQKILELGVVPMAVPLLVGPGSIVTGILILDRDGYLVTLLAIVMVFLVCWVLFQLSPLLNRIMGKIGRMVISRILWIFMAAIGVHFLISGIKATFGI